MFKRTVRALYENETLAAQARAQLEAAGFHDIEIVGKHAPHGLVEALERLVAIDHWRSEVERGCVMLVAHVDAQRETEVAEIVDASSLGQCAHDAH
jgi:hypothetical protein